MFDFIKKLFKKKEIKMAPMEIKKPKPNNLDFGTFLREEQSVGRGLRKKPPVKVYDFTASTMPPKPKRAFQPAPRAVAPKPAEDTTLSDIAAAVVIDSLLSQRHSTWTESAPEPEKFEGRGGNFSGAGASGSWDNDSSSSSSSSSSDSSSSSSDSSSSSSDSGGGGD